MRYVLTPDETAAARAVGDRRREHSAAYRQCNPEADDPMGAVAEYALAALLGPDVVERWWETQAFSTTPWMIFCDVGRNIQVRATDCKNPVITLHAYHTEDRMPFYAQAFVLARVAPDCSHVSFLGWRMGADVFTDGVLLRHGPYGRPGRSCYGIASNKLYDMLTLPQEYVR